MVGVGLSNSIGVGMSRRPSRRRRLCWISRKSKITLGVNGFFVSYAARSLAVIRSPFTRHTPNVTWETGIAQPGLSIGGLRSQLVHDAGRDGLHIR